LLTRFGWLGVDSSGRIIKDKISTSLKRIASYPEWEWIHADDNKEREKKNENAGFYLQGLPPDQVEKKRLVFA
jgi:hypothetical protein